MIHIWYEMIHQTRVNHKKCPAAQESIKFTPPKLSDEERMSPFFPERMRCDACRAIAYNLFNAFEAKSNGNTLEISESDCYDVYENVCTTPSLNHGR